MIRHRHGLAQLVMGLLIGACLVQAETWHQRAQLTNAARMAQLDAQHWRQEALRLQDQLAAINRRNQRQTYIQTVTLDVINSPVPLIDVEAALEPYTETLLGLSLEAVKLPLIYQLMNGRRILAGEQHYRVEVKALLVSPDAVILLTLHPIRDTKPP